MMNPHAGRRAQGGGVKHQSRQHTGDCHRRKAAPHRLVSHVHGPRLPGRAGSRGAHHHRCHKPQQLWYPRPGLQHPRPLVGTRKLHHRGWMAHRKEGHRPQGSQRSSGCTHHMAPHHRMGNLSRHQHKPWPQGRDVVGEGEEPRCCEHPVPEPRRIRCLACRPLHQGDYFIAHQGSFARHPFQGSNGQHRTPPLSPNQAKADPPQPSAARHAKP